MSIEKYIATIIEREGGYVDHPADRGGPTKFGITLKTLRDFRMPASTTAKDVEDLSPEEAYQIYKQNYLVKPGIHNIADYGLQALMLDTAVHSGPGRAIKILQQALGIKDDGIIGSVTIQCANALEPSILRRKYLSSRIRYIGGIITSDPTQAVFARGWMNRCGDLLETLV